MKKVISVLLMMMLCLGLVACGNGAANEENNAGNNEAQEMGQTQIANPWSDCATIEEAEGLAGFQFDSIKNAEISIIRAMVGENYNIIEAGFADGDNRITLRKGNTAEDISGDYTEYANSTTVDMDGTTLTFKGNTEGMTALVTWQKDGFSYSIHAAEETKTEYMQSYVDVVFE